MANFIEYKSSSHTLLYNLNHIVVAYCDVENKRINLALTTHVNTETFDHLVFNSEQKAQEFYNKIKNN